MNVHQSRAKTAQIVYTNGHISFSDYRVKVYLNPDALSEIHCERELAFVAGVPTAIPYDVVRIEGEATVLSLSF